MKNHRTWAELLKEPPDMNEAELERLRRIKEIPKEVRNVLTARLEVLTNVVMSAEREMDTIKDFLNGERSTYTDD